MLRIPQDDGGFMNKISKIALFTAGFSLLSGAAYAEMATLTVGSTSIENGKPIPSKFAFCKPDGKGKTEPAENISPEIHWSGAPEGTKSFAIVVVDPDVPAKFDDANKEGKTIAEDFPRQNFYHWVQVDIPVTVTSIEEGNDTLNSFPAKYRGNPFINDFASFIKDKPATDFLGYDGPCPPFNDKRLHHYHFTVYALDNLWSEQANKLLSSLGKDAIPAIEKHAIAKGEIVGTYSNFVAK